MLTWVLAVIGLLAVAFLIFWAVVAWVIPTTSRGLFHKHQIGHEMNAAFGRAWDLTDLAGAIWNVEIESVELIDEENAELITLWASSPDGPLHLQTRYDIESNTYGEYIPLDSFTLAAMTKGHGISVRGCV